MEPNQFTFAFLIDLIRTYIRSYIIVAVVAVAVGVVISMPMFMQPDYQSTAIVYPVNINSYSDESETEQLLQYFESSALRDTLINRYNLYDRYSIDREDAGSRFAVLRDFNEHFSINKTKYESVKIEVIDADPEVAKAMTDDALSLVNTVINDAVNKRGSLMAESYAQQMAFQRTAIDSIEAAVSKLSLESGVLEYGSQSRELMRGLVDIAAKGGSVAAKKEIEDLLSQTQQSGSTIRMLQNLSYFQSVNFEFLSKEYLRNREMSLRDVNYIDVVVAPEVADKKVRPVRWLVVAVSLLAGLSFLTVYIALTRSFRKA